MGGYTAGHRAYVHLEQCTQHRIGACAHAEAGKRGLGAHGCTRVRCSGPFTNVCAVCNHDAWGRKCECPRHAVLMGKYTCEYKCVQACFESMHAVWVGPTLS